MITTFNTENFHYVHSIMRHGHQKHSVAMAHCSSWRPLGSLLYSKISDYMREEMDRKKRSFFKTKMDQKFVIVRVWGASGSDVMSLWILLKIS